MQNNFGPHQGTNPIWQQCWPDIISQKSKSKICRANLIHTFSWRHSRARYLTPVHRFCLSDSPRRRKVRCVPLIVGAARRNPSGCIPPLLGLSIDISDGTLEEKLASFVSCVTLMADLFQGAKHWQASGLGEQTARARLSVSSCRHSA